MAADSGQIRALGNNEVWKRVQSPFRTWFTGTIDGQRRFEGGPQGMLDRAARGRQMT